MTLELIPLTTATETLALVPAAALSWHQVQLPPGTLRTGALRDRAGPRLRAVLEGLLEDQLLDDPALLHFALEPAPRAQAPVWVAVCERAWLREQVEKLTRQGRTPQRLLPEWAPDGAQGQLWITGSEDAPQAQWLDAQGVQRLPLPQGPDAGTPAWAAARDSLTLWAEPAVAALAEKLLGRQPRVESTATRLQHSANSAWDLAQFDMARRNPLLERLRRAVLQFVAAPAWAPARWSLLALVVVSVLGLNLQAWQVNAQLQAQRAQLREILLGNFPQVKVVVDPPLQMERALADLRQTRGATSPRDLEYLLAAWGSATGIPATAPNSLDFANGELRLSGLALSAQQVGTLDAQMRQAGVSLQADGPVLVLRPRSKP